MANSGKVMHLRDLYAELGRKFLDVHSKSPPSPDYDDRNPINIINERELYLPKRSSPLYKERILKPEETELFQYRYKERVPDIERYDYPQYEKQQRDTKEHPRNDYKVLPKDDFSRARYKFENSTLSPTKEKFSPPPKYVNRMVSPDLNSHETKIDSKRNLYEGSSAEGLSTFIDLKSSGNDYLKDLFTNLMIIPEINSDKASKEIINVTNNYIESIFGLVEAKESYTKEGAKRVGKDFIYKINRIIKDILNSLLECINNKRVDHYMRESQDILIKFKAIVKENDDLKEMVRESQMKLKSLRVPKDIPYKKSNDNEELLRKLLNTLNPKTDSIAKSYDSKKLIESVGAECKKLMAINSGIISESEKRDKKEISKKETETIMEELTSQNYKLENELNLLKQDSKSKDKIISNITKETESFASENRELSNLVIKLYTLINNKIPTTKKIINILGSV